MFFHQTGEQRRAGGDNVIVKVVAGVVHHATALLPFLAIAEQVNQQAAQGFSPEERDTLRRLLLRLADNLSETQEDTE